MPNYDDPHARRRRRLARPLVALLGALSGLVALVLALAGPASAATGYGLDGQDPVFTKCWNSAYVVNSAPVVISGFGGSAGTAYLWYSNGCGTNWVSVTTSTSNPNGRPAPITTNVYRQSPYSAQNYTGYFTYGPGAQSWSNMVYAPASCAKGYVQMDVGFATASTYVYQNSCRF